MRDLNEDATRPGPFRTRPGPATRTNSRRLWFALLAWPALAAEPSLRLPPLLTRAPVMIANGTARLGLQVSPRELRARGRRLAPVLLLRGMMNTGTNVMTAELRSNIADSSFDWPKGWQPPFGCNKHTPLPLVLDEFEPPAVQLGYLTIIVLRHPITWIVSMRKAPYHFACEDWCALERCSLEKLNPRAYALCAMPRIEKKYEVLEDAWVEWAEGATRFRTPHIAVRYEDFLLEPERVVRAVAETARSRVREGRYALIEESAKTGPYHKGSHGRAAAIEALWGASIPGLLGYPADGTAAVATDSLLGCWSEPTADGAADAVRGDPALAERLARRLAGNDKLQQLCDRFGYQCR
jgi:hypothetical protein